MGTQQEHRSVEQRRAQLVDAALLLLRTQGVRGLTTRAVTGAADLPHGSFHYCFATKSDFYRAILERQLRAAMAASFAPYTAGLSPEYRIAAGLSSHLQRIRTDPSTALALLELLALSRHEEGLSEVAYWEQDAYVAAVEDHIAGWAKDQGFRWLAHTNEISRLLIASADGIATMWLNDRDTVRAERAIALAAKTIATLTEGVPA
ncbi:TetR/AcrR family transcriptional regulator [Curtobacterium flaccumfaciens]|uniref:TetR/AcrR family transcriptional regulator n=1 Tax=Curtobacterium flaccumfaciens TaxID=2035 RepID=UPI001E2FA3EB|nr:TetR family transcriptional regulator C-terminal domain-containing protein [Curtobacterium allii]MCE0459606.1 TetR family transcriptional regulator C-terminal domain-containing protein [Curtobacterium allii]